MFLNGFRNVVLHFFILLGGALQVNWHKIPRKTLIAKHLEVFRLNALVDYGAFSLSSMQSWHDGDGQRINV